MLDHSFALFLGRCAVKTRISGGVGRAREVERSVLFRVIFEDRIGILPVAFGVASFAHNSVGVNDTIDAAFNVEALHA